MLAHEGHSGDPAYTDTSNSLPMSTNIVDSASPSSSDGRQVETTTTSEVDVKNNMLKIENTIITHSNSPKAHLLSYGTYGNDYEGCKLRPIEERADAIEALQADINDLYRLERTKNRSVGLESLFKDYKPENHPVFL